MPRCGWFYPLVLLLPTVVGQGPIPPWPNSIFYQQITTAPTDPKSDTILANMKASPAAGVGAAKVPMHTHPCVCQYPLL